VLLLATAAGVGGWWFGMGRYTSTPGVIDLTSAQARSRLHSEGLGYQVGGQQFSETVSAGSVIATDPAPGSRILQHGVVTATISKGPERHPVPKLRGMSVDQAQRAIQRAHLSYGHATMRFSERVAKGLVLSSNPASGKDLKRSSVVDIVVSRGPHPVKVPNFTGRQAHHSWAALRHLGFKVARTRQYSDTVPRGDVVSQDPGSGTLFRGQSVHLVVSRGPELFTVPDVRRMSLSEATSTLVSAGFQVSSQRSQFYIGLDLVVAQDPRAGERVPHGTVITLSLV
jgi:serine/threonine-protein kinase